jgi:hypothetical protein
MANKAPIPPPVGGRDWRGGVQDGVRGVRPRRVLDAPSPDPRPHGRGIGYTSFGLVSARGGRA